MSIRYKTVQIKMKGSKLYGQWYGRAVHLETIDTKTLAEEISHSTTVTRSDVAAVLIELFRAMKTHLQASQTVVLDEIGSFRITFKSKPSESEAGFTANNIKQFRVAFRPFSTFIPNGGVSPKGHRTGTYVQSFTSGVTAEPFNKNKKTDDSTGTTTNP